MNFNFRGKLGIKQSSARKGGLEMLTSDLHKFRHWHEQKQQNIHVRVHTHAHASIHSASWSPGFNSHRQMFAWDSPSGLIHNDVPKH